MNYKCHEGLLALISTIEQTSKKPGFSGLALAGGKSPIFFYKNLFKADINWSKISITVTDERVYNDNKYFSNESTIKDCMKDTKVSSKNLIPLEAWPPFVSPTVATLGFGTDGHIASIFPNMLLGSQFSDLVGTPKLIKTEPIGSPHAPRISMNMSMLLSIQNVFLIYKKAEKDATFHSALVGNETPLSYFLANYRHSLQTIYLL